MMTIFAFGSFFSLLATSSSMALAVLSTRHGRLRSGNWIELILLHVGGGGGTSTFTVHVPLPVRLRASVAVTVTLTGPAPAPAVSRVAVVPVPLTRPALAV